MYFIVPPSHLHCVVCIILISYISMVGYAVFVFESYTNYHVDVRETIPLSTIRKL